MPPPPEPVYSFTIPSLDDGTVLDCRLYFSHSTINATAHTTPRGAVLAHPYAPVGGSYDDAVLLALVPTLLMRGYVVVTFNFRGAGGSAGKTSWTGRPEQDDYRTVLGFLIYFLQWLGHDDGPSASANDESRPPLRLLCGGYSYGALILARLPPPETVMSELSAAVAGTTGGEVVLRARKLATDARAMSMETSRANRERGESKGSLTPSDATSHPSTRVSSIIVGGEESPSTQTRQGSPSGRRSLDFIRRSIESPRRIRLHTRHRTDEATTAEPHCVDDGPTDASAVLGNSLPTLITSYLFISPVLVPMTTMLLPPGPSIPFSNHKSKARDHAAAEAFLQRPTLAVFGTIDAFTSCPKLRAWAHKQAEKGVRFEWEQVDGAGHFWHEPGVLRTLQQRVNGWIKDSQVDP